MIEANSAKKTHQVAFIALAFFFLLVHVVVMGVTAQAETAHVEPSIPVGSESHQGFARNRSAGPSPLPMGMPFLHGDDVRKTWLITDEGRECTKCGKFQPWEGFCKGKAARCHSSWCRNCTGRHAREKHPPMGVYKQRISNDEGRECCACNRFLPWECFSSRKVRWCRQCKHEYDVRRNIANKEKNKELGRLRYLNNPSRAILNATQWQKKHPEKRKAFIQKWKKNHPEQVLAESHRRRARLLGAPRGTPWDTWFSGLKKNETYRCYWCRERYPTKCIEPSRLMTPDHLTPVSRGGIDGLENVVACCLSCNGTKNKKTHDEFVAYLIKHKHPAWV